eukprot:272049_1
MTDNKEEKPNLTISQRNILRNHHALLLTLSATFNALLFKSLPAFIAYIMIDYNFSYSFIVTALSMGSLSTAISFILNPLFMHLSCNIAFCIFSLLECLGCFILWYFPHSKVLFIIGVVIICLIQNVCYGCSNAVISTFVSDANISHKYLTALNSSWTIATFMFFGVGYLMQIGSIWVFLQLMFTIFILNGLLNLIFLPKLSTNKYNLSITNANITKDESKIKVSVTNDMKVLLKIKCFWFVMLAIILIFIAWGYFYSTFGPWLKQIFDLNQAQFGYMAGAAEGFGNLFAILWIGYSVKTDDEISNKCYKISLQLMMLYSGLILTIAMLIIFIICYIEWYNEIFLFILIAIYFYGQEAECVCGLILTVNLVPPLQQTRASSMIGIIQSFTVFTAQITVAPIYNFGGMKWQSMLLLIIYFIGALNIIYLNHIMNKPKMKIIDELLPINSDKNIKTYTISHKT